MVELKFGRKKIFLTVLYRSPSFDHASPEFRNFNGKSHLWWPDGDETPEGRKLENMFTSLSLSQVISEPTNFDSGKKTLVY